MTKILTILYFVNLFLYSFFSLVSTEEMTEFFWFVRIPILLILYFASSVKVNIVYIMALLLYQCASFFFHYGTSDTFIYGTFSSVLFKLCLLFLIMDLITKKNYKAISIAFVPFFVILLYMIEMVVESLGASYYVWIFNAFLTSCIGGVAIINYVHQSGQKYYWLLISAVLFLIQIGAFFINKFYVKSEAIYQLVILAYGISHYTFYRFMILKEQEQLQF